MSRVGLILAALISLTVPGAFVGSAIAGAVVDAMKNAGSAQSVTPATTSRPTVQDEADETSETSTQAETSERATPGLPDHAHGLGKIDGVFASMSSSGLWDPERLDDITCFGDGVQEHWRCKLVNAGTTTTYTVHMRPELGSMSYITPGDTPDANVEDSESYALIHGLTHGHGEGSFKVVQRTLEDLNVTNAYRCWGGGGKFASHWKCRIEGIGVVTVHITPKSNPTNYVTEGWGPTSNIQGVNDG